MMNLKKSMAVIATTALFATASFLPAYADAVEKEQVQTSGIVNIKDDQNSSVITYRFPMSLEQKTDELTALGIIEGDPDGNFRFEDKVSRAEFSKIMCMMLNLKGNVSQESFFSDVDSSHWASNYITTAKKAGIINGHGDGTFKPDDDVTYQEALKMVVSSLGYTPMAEARGGYPAGFVGVANQLGFDSAKYEDYSLPAIRSDIFELIHYALDVPLMQQTGFGANVEYAVMNGQNGLGYVTLRTQLVSSDSVEYAEMSEAELEKFTDENKTLIETDIKRYWERMNYEGEYTYEILSVMTSPDGKDIKVKAALMDETEKKYINLELNYKITYYGIK